MYARHVEKLLGSFQNFLHLSRISPPSNEESLLFFKKSNALSLPLSANSHMPCSPTLFTFRQSALTGCQLIADRCLLSSSSLDKHKEAQL